MFEIQGWDLRFEVEISATTENIAENIRNFRCSGKLYRI